MQSKFIFGNWKMAQTLEAGLRFIENWDLPLPDSVEVALFPSSLHLYPVKEAISKKGLKIKLGAQDCSAFKGGAQTGEVSAGMIRELGAPYVLVGHSECRARGQTDTMIREKLDQAVAVGLAPVLCIGETKEERQGAQIFDKLGRQLEVLSGLKVPFIVAYEPIWAIGTGLTPTLMEIQEVHDFIWRQLPEVVRDVECRGVLYGGSVKPKNAKEMLSAQGVTGLLIGGASLELESLKKIVEMAGES